MSVAPSKSNGCVLETSDVQSLLKGHELIALVNRLRGFGAHLSVDLPHIVLCGQQSSGKSSVSEAISGVALPRNHGTCTRCPTEVRLTSQNDEKKEWKCHVKIRWEWDDAQMTWRKQVFEEDIGTVNDPKDVAALVSEAQTKLLEKAGVKFSRNVICVEVQSHECVDLTVVDLPGLIFAVEKEEDVSYIELTRFLVTDYISRPNTLIAAVISCNNDMENQLINSLIREYDPHGYRTLGILTKVDTIEKELEKPWMDLITGKAYPLMLGYVAVRNPSQHELKHIQSFQEARVLEQEFFQTNPVWNSCDVPQNRLGCNALVQILSDKLSQLIAQQLPKIQTQLVNKLHTLEAELKKLPPPPPPPADDTDIYGTDNMSDSKETIVALILTFTDICKELVRHKSGDLWNRIMHEYAQFFKKLESLQPQFVVSKSKRRRDNCFTIEDVKSENDKCIGRELNFSVSDNARKKFLFESMKEWEAISMQLLSNICNILCQVILHHVQMHFLHFNNLFVHCKESCVHLITEVLFAQCKKEVMQLLAREKCMDEFTLSSHRLLHTYDRVKSQFEKIFPTSHEKDKMRKQSIRQAIVVMAQSVSYYDLAFRRYADNVAMAVNSLFIHAFSQCIQTYMFKSINLLHSDAKDLSSLLTENPEITAKRNNLQQSIAQLSLFIQELNQTVSAASVPSANTSVGVGSSVGSLPLSSVDTENVPPETAHNSTSSSATPAYHNHKTKSVSIELPLDVFTHDKSYPLGFAHKKKKRKNHEKSKKRRLWKLF